MGLFKRKGKVVKEIQGGAWGHLVSEHKIDVDTLANEMRCVEREEVANGGKITFLRVFKLSEARRRGIEVKGWETFDEYPDLILFEGYLTGLNTAKLERKRAQ